MSFRKTVFVISVLLATACISGCGAEEKMSDAELWQTAVEDAVISDDDEVMELVTLTADDDRVIWDDEGKTGAAAYVA